MQNKKWNIFLEAKARQEKKELTEEEKAAREEFMKKVQGYRARIADPAKQRAFMEQNRAERREQIKKMLEERRAKHKERREEDEK